MKNIWTIMKRDLGAYLKQPMGYVILASALALDGLLFNAFAFAESRPSEKILQELFWAMGGVHLVAAVFMSMRMLAEEKQLGTLTLLNTSPVKNSEIVLGKFLSGVFFLILLCALSVYLPGLVWWAGKVSMAHIAAGYLGVLLLSSAGLALSLFSSSFASNQLVSVILSAFVIVTFVVFWMIAKVADAPLADMIAYLSFFHKHYVPFCRGLVSIQDLVFYISLIYVALVGTTRVLEMRRWA